VKPPICRIGSLVSGSVTIVAVHGKLWCALAIASYKASFFVETPASFRATYHVEPHGALRLTAAYSITSSLPMVVVEISSSGRPTAVSLIKRVIVGLSFSGSSVQNGFGNEHSSPSSLHFLLHLLSNACWNFLPILYGGDERLYARFLQVLRQLQQQIPVQPRRQA
jgi:hypothetical protein